MRIKPTHTESDVRTEYLCVCRDVVCMVCWCVGVLVCWTVSVLVCEISRHFFFDGAGRAREGETGAYDNYEYIVCSTIRTDSSFSRRGGYSVFYLSAKAERQENRTQISPLLSLINGPIYSCLAGNHIDDKKQDG